MEDNERNSSAINALLDITDNLSVCSGNISEKSRLVTDDKVRRTYSVVENVTRTLSSMSIIDAQGKSKNLNKSEEKSPGSNKSEHHSTSSLRITSLETDSTKENYDDDANLNYTSDFSSINSTHSKNEMTAWEKWFLTKQEEIRRKANVERKRAEKERKYQEMLKQKKRKECEECIKQWLERKKVEMQNRQERKEGNTEKLNQGSYSFEHWVLRKYQQKKVEHLRRDYMKKKEEEERKRKAKQNEEAVKRWMAQAKQKPLNPRISYAYRGGSTVRFYDATHPPSPTFVNPVPWKDTCSSD